MVYSKEKDLVRDIVSYINIHKGFSATSQESKGGGYADIQCTYNSKIFYIEVKHNHKLTTNQIWKAKKLKFINNIDTYLAKNLDDTKNILCKVERGLINKGDYL
jgi:hypothetical protein|tara:strand:- start:8861 stop:9172 length:312 start_codon:yes stop_codon:yes gene_type:complete